MTNLIGLEGGFRTKVNVWSFPNGAHVIVQDRAGFSILKPYLILWQSLA